MTAKTKKAKPNTEPRNNIWLWLKPDDHQRLREAAANRGMPMSEFSRTVVLQAIESVLGKKR